jgi:hypothetical protein
MNEVIRDDHNNNNNNNHYYHHPHHHIHNNNVSSSSGSSRSNSQTYHTKYNYMCDECGDAFSSLDEYIEHFKHYHPRSIGTAIT